MKQPKRNRPAAKLLACLLGLVILVSGISTAALAAAEESASETSTADSETSSTSTADESYPTGQDDAEEDEATADESDSTGQDDTKEADIPGDMAEEPAPEEKTDGDDTPNEYQEDDPAKSPKAKTALGTFGLPDGSGIMPMAEIVLPSQDESGLVSAIAAAASGDTILIGSDITLDAPLTIDKNLTFKSMGGNAALQNTGLHRHMNVTADAVLIFEGVALDGNGNGGGISIGAHTVELQNATIQNCVWTANEQDAGAILLANGGNLTLTGGTFTNNNGTRYGGAINAGKNSTISITNAHFEGNSATNVPGTLNSATYGGALWAGSGSALTITGSTFVNNMAGGGAAVYFTGDTISITGSSFTQNNSYDGVLYIYGISSGLLDSIVVDSNTAACGLYYGGDNTLTVNNCDFTNNTGTRGGGIKVGSGTLYMTGGSISDNTANDGAGMSLDGGVNYPAYATLIGVTINNNHSNSGPNYGGGIYGNQRSHLQLENCDVTNNSSNYGGIASHGYVSVTGGSISGNSATKHGGGIHSIEYISQTEPVGLKISDVTFTGNSANGDGGAIQTQVPTSITGSTFTNNTSDAFGGALAIWQSGNYDATTIITNSALTGNGAANGGQLYVYKATCNITGSSTINNGVASNTGGAAYITNNATLALDGTGLDKNGADNHGGGIYANSSTLKLNGATFTGNESKANGGAIYGNYSNLLGNSATFTGNTANDGGAVFLNDSGFDYENSGFTGNNARYNGGAVYVDNNSDMKAEGSTFAQNDAPWYGGAIYVNNSAKLITGAFASFTGNTAICGGAIYAEWYTTSHFTDTLFDGNTATGDGSTTASDDGNGGAVVITLGGKATFTDSTLKNNIGGQYGGGISASQGAELLVDGGLLKDNKATLEGGALDALGASIELKGAAELRGNTAMDGGAIALNAGTGNVEDDLQLLETGTDVEFYDNVATNGGYNINPIHTSLHSQQIKGNVFTLPFDNAYNNHDVKYFNPPAIYTVTYKADGSTHTVWALASTGFTNGSKAFLGWHTDATGNDFAGTAYAPNSTFTVSGNTTLYAQWQAQSFQLTYNAMGGSYTPPSQTFQQGDYATKPTTSPQKTGYEFLGWYTEANGGSAWSFSATPLPGHSMTLYAHYKTREYTLTYDHNNGSGQKDTFNVAYNALLPTTNNPTHTGYTFAGWEDKNGNLWNFSTGRMPAADMTLTARWTANDTPPSTTTSTGSPNPGDTSSTGSSTSRGSSSSTVSASGSSSVPVTVNTRSQSSSSTAAVANVQAPPESSSTPEIHTTEEDPGADVMDISGGRGLPLGGLTARDGWSLLNLLLSVLACLGLLTRVVLHFVRRRNEDEACERTEAEMAGLEYIAQEKEEKEAKRHGLLARFHR